MKISSKYQVKYILSMKNCSITILTNKRKVKEYETTLVVMPSEFIMYFHQGTVFMSSIGKYKSTLIRSLIWIPVTVSHCRVTCNAIISCIYRYASPLHVLHVLITKNSLVSKYNMRKNTSISGECDME